MFHLIKTAVGEIVSKVSDGEPVRESISPPFVKEEEVLFCKNNVCVHLPRSSKHKSDLQHNQYEQVPGYFSLKKTAVIGLVPELVLTWVPNSLLTVSNIDTSVQEGLEIVTCSEVDTSCVSASEEDIVDDITAGVKEKQSEESNVNQQIARLKSEGTENGSVVFMECSRGHSPLSLSPRHESAEPFSTPYGGVFSINLSDMKAVKLFLASREGTNGQLVISSLENQYKVFHFHHSGIDKPTNIFSEWEGCQEEKKEDFSETLQKVFHVSKNFKLGMKTETGADMHPEDGHYIPLNLTAWRGFNNALGQIEDVNNFRKHVFFAGLTQEVRPDAWKFLLYCYPIQSTSFERDRIRKEKEDDYKSVHNKRLALTGENYEKFWKDIQFTVDKDVVRTDRSHPFFAGQDNPNVAKMRNILLNYAIYNPDMGYTQGMSDLLAPLLSTIQDEVDTFWSFVGLMEFSLFATTPTDKSMDISLGYLRELLRVMHPEFYIHYLMQDEELDLLFCHRWLVLCFKREFIEPEVLSLWEACWSRYQTDYFHIFICVAIIRLYGNKCIEARMRVDEMMQYFMSMAMQFDGSAVLREARSLLYRFRRFQVIPCTLEGFLSGPGVWDGGIEPEIECMSRHRKCCIVESNDIDTNVNEIAQELNEANLAPSNVPEEEALGSEASTNLERPSAEKFNGELSDGGEVSSGSEMKESKNGYVEVREEDVESERKIVDQPLS